MLCSGPLHFAHIAYYVYDICPLPDTDVAPSILVGLCDVEHNSFQFGLGRRKFVLCLFGECPGFCTIVIAGSTQEVYTFLFG